MKMKMLGVSALVVAALALAVSYAAGTPTAGSSLAAITKTGKLRIAVMVGEPPGFIHEKDGSWAGYCALIEEQIASRLGLKPVPVVTTWGNMALDVQTGKIDVAACAQPTGKRAEVVDYTVHPIYTNYFSLIVKNPDLKAASWVDLNKKSVTIGVQVGDSTIQPIKMFAPNATIKTFQTRDEGLLALQAGQIDAEANTLLNSLVAVKARKDLNARVVVPEPLVAAPSSVLVKRSLDQSFLNVVDTVVWNLNASGFDRSVILESLKSYGITAADLPTNAPL